ALAKGAPAARTEAPEGPKDTPSATKDAPDTGKGSLAAQKDSTVASKGLPAAAKVLPVAALALPTAAQGALDAAKGAPDATKTQPVEGKGGPDGVVDSPAGVKGLPETPGGSASAASGSPAIEKGTETPAKETPSGKEGPSAVGSDTEPVVTPRSRKGGEEKPKGGLLSKLNRKVRGKKKSDAESAGPDLKEAAAVQGPPDTHKEGPKASEGAPSQARNLLTVVEGSPDATETAPDAPKSALHAAGELPAGSGAFPTAGECTQDASKGLPDGSKGTPGAPKSIPDSSKGAPDAPKGTPVAAKGGVTASPDGSGGAKSAPKATDRAPDGPKGATLASRDLAVGAEGTPSAGKDGPDAAKEAPPGAVSTAAAGVALPAAAMASKGASEAGPGAGEGAAEAPKTSPGVPNSTPRGDEPKRGLMSKLLSIVGAGKEPEPGDEVVVSYVDQPVWGQALTKPEVGELNDELSELFTELGIDPTKYFNRPLDDFDSPADFYEELSGRLEGDTQDVDVTETLATRLGDDHPLVVELRRREALADVKVLDEYIKGELGPEKAAIVYKKVPDEFRTPLDYYKELQGVAKAHEMDLVPIIEAKLGKTHPLPLALRGDGIAAKARWQSIKKVLSFKPSISPAGVQGEPAQPESSDGVAAAPVKGRGIAAWPLPGEARAAGKAAPERKGEPGEEKKGALPAEAPAGAPAKVGPAAGTEAPEGPKDTPTAKKDALDASKGSLAAEKDSTKASKGLPAAAKVLPMAAMALPAAAQGALDAAKGAPDDTKAQPVGGKGGPDGAGDSPAGAKGLPKTPGEAAAAASGSPASGKGTVAPSSETPSGKEGLSAVGADAEPVVTPRSGKGGDEKPKRGLLSKLSRKVRGKKKSDVESAALDMKEVAAMQGPPDSPKEGPKASEGAPSQARNLLTVVEGSPDATETAPDAPKSALHAAGELPAGSGAFPTAGECTQDASKGLPDGSEGTPGAAKSIPDSSKGAPDAPKGTGDASKGTRDAAKGTPDAARGMRDAPKGTLVAPKGTGAASVSQSTAAAAVTGSKGIPSAIGEPPVVGEGLPDGLKGTGDSPKGTLDAGVPVGAKVSPGVGVGGPDGSGGAKAVPKAADCAPDGPKGATLSSRDLPVGAEGAPSAGKDGPDAAKEAPPRAVGTAAAGAALPVAAMALQGAGKPGPGAREGAADAPNASPRVPKSTPRGDKPKRGLMSKLLSIVGAGKEPEPGDEVVVSYVDQPVWGQALTKPEVGELNDELSELFTELGIDPTKYFNRPLDDFDSPADFYEELSGRLEGDTQDVDVTETLATRLGDDHPLVVELRRREALADVKVLDEYIKGELDPEKAAIVYKKVPDEFRTPLDYYKELQGVAQAHEMDLVPIIEAKLGKTHPLPLALRGDGIAAKARWQSMKKALSFKPSVSPAGDNAKPTQPESSDIAAAVPVKGRGIASWPLPGEDKAAGEAAPERKGEPGEEKKGALPAKAPAGAPAKWAPAARTEAPEGRKDTPSATKDAPDTSKDSLAAEKDSMEASKGLPAAAKVLPVAAMALPAAAHGALDAAKGAPDDTKTQPVGGKSGSDDVKDSPAGVKGLPEAPGEAATAASRSPVAEKDTKAPAKETSSGKEGPSAVGGAAEPAVTPRTEKRGEEKPKRGLLSKLSRKVRGKKKSDAESAVPDVKEAAAVQGPPDTPKGGPDATEGECPQDASKGLPDGSKGTPGAPKSIPDSSNAAPDAPKGTPYAARDMPDTPKGAPDAPKGTGNAPKGTPDAAKGTPDSLKGTPDGSVAGVASVSPRTVAAAPAGPKGIPSAVGESPVVGGGLPDGLKGTGEAPKATTDAGVAGRARVSPGVGVSGPDDSSAKAAPKAADRAPDGPKGATLSSRDLPVGAEGAPSAGKDGPDAAKEAPPRAVGTAAAGAALPVAAMALQGASKAGPGAGEGAADAPNASPRVPKSTPRGDKPKRGLMSKLLSIVGAGKEPEPGDEVVVSYADQPVWGQALTKPEVGELNDELSELLTELGIDPTKYFNRPLDDFDSPADFYEELSGRLEGDTQDVDVTETLATRLGDDHPLVVELRRREALADVKVLDEYIKGELGPEKAAIVYKKVPDEFHTPLDYYKELQGVAKANGMDLVPIIEAKLGDGIAAKARWQSMKKALSFKPPALRAGAQGKPTQPNSSDGAGAVPVKGRGVASWPLPGEVKAAAKAVPEGKGEPGEETKGALPAEAPAGEPAKGAPATGMEALEGPKDTPSTTKDAPDVPKGSPAAKKDSTEGGEEKPKRGLLSKLSRKVRGKKKSDTEAAAPGVKEAAAIQGAPDTPKEGPDASGGAPSQAGDLPVVAEGSLDAPKTAPDAPKSSLHAARELPVGSGALPTAGEGTQAASKRLPDGLKGTPGAPKSTTDSLKGAPDAPKGSPDAATGIHVVPTGTPDGGVAVGATESPSALVAASDGLKGVPSATGDSAVVGEFSPDGSKGTGDASKGRADVGVPGGAKVAPGSGVGGADGPSGTNDADGASDGPKGSSLASRDLPVVAEGTPSAGKDRPDAAKAVPPGPVGAAATGAALPVAAMTSQGAGKAAPAAAEGAPDVAKASPRVVKGPPSGDKPKRGLMSKLMSIVGAGKEMGEEVAVSYVDQPVWGQALTKPEVGELNDELAELFTELGIDPTKYFNRPLDDFNTPADFYEDLSGRLEGDTQEVDVTETLATRLGDDHPLVVELQRREALADVKMLDEYIKGALGPEKAATIYKKVPDEFHTPLGYYKELQGVAKANGMDLVPIIEAKLGEMHSLPMALRGDGIAAKAKWQSMKKALSFKPSASPVGVQRKPALPESSDDEATAAVKDRDIAPWPLPGDAKATAKAAPEGKGEPGTAEENARPAGTPIGVPAKGGPGAVTEAPKGSKGTPSAAKDAPDTTKGSPAVKKDSTPGAVAAPAASAAVPVAAMALQDAVQAGPATAEGVHDAPDVVSALPETSGNALAAPHVDKSAQAPEMVAPTEGLGPPIADRAEAGKVSPVEGTPRRGLLSRLSRKVRSKRKSEPDVAVVLDDKEPAGGKDSGAPGASQDFTSKPEVSADGAKAAAVKALPEAAKDTPSATSTGPSAARDLPYEAKGSPHAAKDLPALEYGLDTKNEAQKVVPVAAAASATGSKAMKDSPKVAPDAVHDTPAANAGAPTADVVKPAAAAAVSEPLVAVNALPDGASGGPSPENGAEDLPKEKSVLSEDEKDMISERDVRFSQPVGGRHGGGLDAVEAKPKGRSDVADSPVAVREGVMAVADVRVRDVDVRDETGEDAAPCCSKCGCFKCCCMFCRKCCIRWVNCFGTR
ncbi:unnamed protein product, partial [Ostreobium quekettii]